ncbi:carbohydrate ABC transporter permease [Leptothoe kymatousa]|uniref:Sugar ABC transporter permease n=1 Tax=Leptothoe kymatousa TAU-MAC 1615 TaxID=2364775 RepID=A0ABS5Y5P9_9CYAN|nr:sugar ABC transporter permease [Leptothoe kymatousa]MBT9312961.1 sugar ABC transporter permease [Leptothoe kymatousa TAU-MAC 1615]
MSDNVLRILTAIVAIATGSVGTFAIFYGLNLLVERLPRLWKDRLLPWVYMGPAMVMLTAYLVLPTLRTLYLSFLDSRSVKFVGLKNYAFALTNPDMVIAFRNNLLWLLLVSGISVGLGLIIAVLVDRVKYESAAKSLIFLPMAISFVGASVIWRFIYAFKPAGTDQIGLLNALRQTFGLKPLGWLIQRDGVLEPVWAGLGLDNLSPLPTLLPLNTLALIIIMIWLQTGFCMVLLSAAVKGIPKDVLEAARIDGANEFQIFRRIIIPMIMPTITVVATTVVVAVLKVFDIVYVMTGGNLDTDVIASRMIKEMFNFRNFGRGSAIATMLLLAVIPVMVTNIRRFTQQEANR